MKNKLFTRPSMHYAHVSLTVRHFDCIPSILGLQCLQFLKATDEFKSALKTHLKLSYCLITRIQ